MEILHFTTDFQQIGDFFPHFYIYVHEYAIIKQVLTTSKNSEN